MSLVPGKALLIVLCVVSSTRSENRQISDICAHINGQRVFLEYGESGTLEAKYADNLFDRYLPGKSGLKRCSVELVSCPSCVVVIRFRFLNLSRDCGRTPIFDDCGCDYVWIYQPGFEHSSQQFCGKFANSTSALEYKSQTRKVIVAFLYNSNYEHAFSLLYHSKRNKISLIGVPKPDSMNNASQTLSSPYFPNLYPSDLTMEHTITCESINVTCFISLVFTDFLLAPSSVLDFFDWNGERIYVTTGNTFRPPVITSSGSSLMIRFYANGATNLGFKAYYTFVLGQPVQAPDIDCGGHVSNLGGGITMMDMVNEGVKWFDCVWLIKPPDTYFHMKTHLYVKVVDFVGFAGSTELTIHQGLTSNGAVLENRKLSHDQFYLKQKEHIVPVSEGFYVRLKGLFRPDSRLELVYTAFNYKDCLTGSDFLCRNKRCISSLLKCDGFDHCGDNSDEYSISCAQDPRDRRQWSKTPNFLFPKDEGFELSTSTLMFLLCSFGLFGFICAMIVLLYRANLKSRQERQIQDHIETITAILEEEVDVEEEIIIPDDPPDYEAPPNYDDVMKTATKRCVKERDRTSRSCQTTPVRIPESPPPAYNENDATPCASTSQAFNPKSSGCWQLSTKDCCNLLSNVTVLICKPRKTFFSDSDLAYVAQEYISTDLDRFHLQRSFSTDNMHVFI